MPLVYPRRSVSLYQVETPKADADTLFKALRAPMKMSEI